MFSRWQTMRSIGLVFPAHGGCFVSSVRPWQDSAVQQKSLLLIYSTIGRTSGSIWSDDKSAGKS